MEPIDFESLQPTSIYFDRITERIQWSESFEEELMPRILGIKIARSICLQTKWTLQYRSAERSEA